MATKSRTGTHSPSTSSALLPLNTRRSRRGSVGSVSSISQVDKEALSHALDQIHSAASQSATLTTFNQFTTPPQSSSGAEGKGIASDLQGGISGLYSRFRASVAGNKEFAASTATLLEGGGDDASSSKSSKDGISNLTASTKRLYYDSKDPNATASNEIPRLDRDHATLAKSSKSSLNNTHDVTSKDYSAAPLMVPGQTVKLSGQTKSLGNQSSPLTQANIASVVAPAVVEISVSTITSGKSHSRNTSQTPNDVPENPPKSTRNDNGVSRSNQSLEQPKNVDDHSPRPKLQSSTSSFSHGDKPQTSQTRQYRGSESMEPLVLERTTAPSRRATRVSELRGEPSQTVSVIDPDENGSVSSRQDTMAIYDGPSSIPESYNESSVPPALVSEPAKDSFPRHDSKPRDTLALPKPHQPHALPGFNLSRTSSMDTGGGSSINTTVYSKSTEAGSSVVPVPDVLPLKAVATTQVHSKLSQEVVLSQIRSRVLSKEFWMRDENAKDCFYCSDPFSTFRRKHHCSE